MKYFLNLVKQKKIMRKNTYKYFKICSKSLEHLKFFCILFIASYVFLNSYVHFWTLLKAEKARS